MNNEQIDRIESVWSAKYGPNDDRIIVRSPGRVNLIGEHTDYNEGFVLPAAIDRAILLMVSPRADARIRLYAMDLQEEFETSLAPDLKPQLRWCDYLVGVARELFLAGHPLSGFDCVFGGDIPVGAGMSSSAAIEGGLAFALNRIFNLRIDPLTLVRLAQNAENNFVGVRCGIMDQFINIFGKSDRALRLDCRSLSYEEVPFERPDVSIVLCDTKVRRALASSEYNLRRRQCEIGVAAIRRRHAGIRSLRDVTRELLEEHRRELDPVVYRRCDYVIGENARVLYSCDHLKNNDYRAFGLEMYASHAGLRDQYEVSAPELDVLVELAGSLGGVFGARMMGAGFGGCTINLVEEARCEEFVREIRALYRNQLGGDCEVHTARIHGGTALVSPAGVNVQL
ncbi:MAG TPA: galactokinase [Bacteroidota bacterium]|nr:galactokinase [Bacteroidota bacterium]